MTSSLQHSPTKTVVVLGAAYGGYRATHQLAEGLPKGWRVIAIDRNTHFNHLYVFPRFSVLPGHEYKGFIPYTEIFGNADKSAGHLILHATVTKLEPHCVTLSRSFPEHGIVAEDGEEPKLCFDYAVYALGGHMPPPINLWGPVGDEEEESIDVISPASTPKLTEVEQVQPWAGPALSEVTTASKIAHSEPLLAPEVGTKPGGVDWLRRSQKYIEKAPSVLVVGGGALGIQYATDIADIYPDKSVTLLHSRDRLLPRFDESMHHEIVAALSTLNVTTLLGDRLDLSYPQRRERNKNGILEHVVHTTNGHEIRANTILLCLGQKPNTDLIEAMLPNCIVPDGPSRGMIRITRNLQVAVPAQSEASSLARDLAKLSVEEGDELGEEEFEVPYPHIFAVGDCADAFGAINAGHTAHAQALIASSNIIKLIEARERTSNGDASEVELGRYYPGRPGIKMTIGRNTQIYQVGDQVGRKSECPDELHVPIMWKYMWGREVSDEEMHS